MFCKVKYGKSLKEINHLNKDEPARQYLLCAVRLETSRGWDRKGGLKAKEGI